MATAAAAGASRNPRRLPATRTSPCRWASSRGCRWGCRSWAARGANRRCSSSRMRTSKHRRCGDHRRSRQLRGTWDEGRGMRDAGVTTSTYVPRPASPVPRCLDAADPEINVVVDPLPELGLLLWCGAGAVVLLPRVHHLVIDRPHADAMPRHLLLPAHGDRRAREENAHRHVLRQVLELTDVDPLVAAEAVALRLLRVGNAVGHEDDVQRREHEILPRDERGHAVEEWIEVGEAVVVRILLPQILRDLGDAHGLEGRDRLERLRLLRMFAANRADETRRRLLETAEPVEMSVYVIRSEV